MKRSSIFLVLILFVSLLGGHRSRHAAKGRCEGLLAWYADYNSGYFQDKLPKNVIIDYDEHEYLASTMLTNNGRFRISFNKDYASSPRVAHLFLLHEMCHIKTWDEWDNLSDHGPHWRSCMLVLDFDNAFRRELIDGYE